MIMHRVCRRMLILGATLAACNSSPPPVPPDAALPGDAQLPVDLADLAARDLPPPDTLAPGRGPPYPIVLCHGFFGFEKIGPIDYFYNVRPALEADGHVVDVPTVDPFNSTYVRGEQLLQQVKEILIKTGAAKVNLVGHSQGGLDARYVAAKLPEHVAAVVTIAAPHGGAAIADALLGKAGGVSVTLLQAFFAAVGKPVWGDAAKDPNVKACLEFIGPDNMADFNARYPNHPDVAYYSIAGRSLLRKAEKECYAPKAPPFITKWSKEIDPVDPLFLVTGQYLEGWPWSPKPNDGLIHVTSAKWGTWLGCIPADHPDEIGHFFGDGAGIGNGFDYITFYRGVAGWLVQQGY
jgi:triacylglycerol lipase